MTIVGAKSGLALNVREITSGMPSSAAEELGHSLFSEEYERLDAGDLHAAEELTIPAGGFVDLDLTNVLGTQGRFSAAGFGVWLFRALRLSGAGGLVVSGDFANGYPQLQPGGSLSIAEAQQWRWRTLQIVSDGSRLLRLTGTPGDLWAVELMFAPAAAAELFALAAADVSALMIHGPLTYPELYAPSLWQANLITAALEDMDNDLLYVIGTEDISGTIRVRFTPGGLGGSRVHGFMDGQKIQITGVTGTTNANGTWTIARDPSDATKLDLVGSIYNGAWAGGGTARIAKYPTPRELDFGLASSDVGRATPGELVNYYFGYVQSRQPQAALIGYLAGELIMTRHGRYYQGPGFTTNRSPRTQLLWKPEYGHSITALAITSIAAGANGRAKVTATSHGFSFVNVTAAVDEGSTWLITAAGHGLETGQGAHLSNLGGLTPNRYSAQNITKIDANQFRINADPFTGTYTSGGQCAKGGDLWITGASNAAYNTGDAHVVMYVLNANELELDTLYAGDSSGGTASGEEDYFLWPDLSDPDLRTQWLADAEAWVDEQAGLPNRPAGYYLDEIAHDSMASLGTDPLTDWQERQVVRLSSLKTYAHSRGLHQFCNLTYQMVGAQSIVKSQNAGGFLQFVVPFSGELAVLSNRYAVKSITVAEHSQSDKNGVHTVTGVPSAGLVTTATAWAGSAGTGGNMTFDIQEDLDDLVSMVDGILIEGSIQNYERRRGPMISKLNNLTYLLSRGVCLGIHAFERVSNGTISVTADSGGKALFTTGAAHNLVVGDPFAVYDHTDTDYEGLVGYVTEVVSSTQVLTTLTYAGTGTGLWVSTRLNRLIPITSIVDSGGDWLVTCTQAHELWPNVYPRVRVYGVYAGNPFGAAAPFTSFTALEVAGSATQLKLDTTGASGSFGKGILLVERVDNGRLTAGFLQLCHQVGYKWAIGHGPQLGTAIPDFQWFPRMLGAPTGSLVHVYEGVNDFCIQLNKSFENGNLQVKPLIGSVQLDLTKFRDTFSTPMAYPVVTGKLCDGYGCWGRIVGLTGGLSIAGGKLTIVGGASGTGDNIQLSMPDFPRTAGHTMVYDLKNTAFEAGTSAGDLWVGWAASANPPDRSAYAQQGLLRFRNAALEMQSGTGPSLGSYAPQQAIRAAESLQATGGFLMIQQPSDAGVWKLLFRHYKGSFGRMAPCILGGKGTWEVEQVELATGYTPPLLITGQGELAAISGSGAFTQSGEQITSAGGSAPWIATRDVGTQDVLIEVRLDAGAASASGQGIAVWVVDVNNFWKIVATPTQMTIQRRFGGTYDAPVAAIAITQLGNLDRLMVRTHGDEIRAWFERDGDHTVYQSLSHVASAPLKANKHGVIMMDTAKTTEQVRCWPVRLTTFPSVPIV